MTYPRQATARLIDTDGTTVVSGTPLENAFGPTWLDEANGPGQGTIMIPLSEAGSAEATPGRFVQILVEGTPRFTFAIEGDPKYKVVKRDEEYEQVMVVAGRGWVGDMLDQVNVEPSNLTLGLNDSWRRFSFASPDFPNAGAWAAADELYEYLDGASYPSAASPYRAPVAPDGLRYPAPIGYPFPISPNIYDIASPPGASYVDTYWIWPSGEETSIGFAFFLVDLTIPDDGVYSFTITADNFFTLFLEGIPILGERSNHNIWKYWLPAEIGLEAGTYQIGVFVENTTIGASGANPAGLIMNVFTLDGGQRPETSILVTDSNWTCVFASTVWPGWTPGQIIDTLLTEGTTRGCLSAFAGGTFAALTDSDGNAWADAQDGSPYIPTFAADVGETILKALDKMVDEGHIDWHGSPSSPELDVWAQGSHGSASGVSLVEGTNLLTFERGSTDIYANALLVQWDRGYVRVEDTAAITALGTRIEGFLSSDAMSEDEATRHGDNELARLAADGWPAIVATVEPTSTADCPYEAFDLLDTVTVPAVGGGTESQKVLSISGSADPVTGYVTWRTELGRRWRNTERQNYDLFRQIGGRQGRGYGAVS